MSTLQTEITFRRLAWGWAIVQRGNERFDLGVFRTRREAADHVDQTFHGYTLTDLSATEKRAMLDTRAGAS